MQVTPTGHVKAKMIKIMHVKQPTHVHNSVKCGILVSPRVIYVKAELLSPDNLIRTASFETVPSIYVCVLPT